MSFSITAYAHSGRTDDLGGHYDTFSGEYHYHHGYPEHSHINGCPYDYDDKTATSISSVSSEKSSNVFWGDYYFISAFIFSIIFFFVILSKTEKHTGTILFIYFSLLFIPSIAATVNCFQQQDRTNTAVSILFYMMYIYLSIFSWTIFIEEIKDLKKRKINKNI